MQIQCVNAYRLEYPSYRDLLFAIPNGGSRSWRVDKYGNKFSPEAMRLKRMGVVKGVPDLMLAVPRGVYHGVFIELKTPQGTVSDAQAKMMIKFAGMGYAVHTARYLSDFRAFIRGYMELKPGQAYNLVKTPPTPQDGHSCKREGHNSSGKLLLTERREHATDSHAAHTV